MNHPRRPRLDIGFPPSDDAQPDPDLDRVFHWFNEQPNCASRFGMCVRTALDEVIDTPRTRRWDLRACGTQEMAYVGVKLEHVIREEFDLGPVEPRKPDYCIDGIYVDCKWTKDWYKWSIPTEAIGQICLLVWAADHDRQMAVGLVRIRRETLTSGKGNKDGKRNIKAAARDEIRWLTKSALLPENFVLHLPAQDRDAILSHRGGDARARELFSRCDGVIIKRHTLESIGQQRDDMRRFRGNTRKKLREDGFEVLNGWWKDDQALAERLGGPVPRGSEEWVCLRADGSSLRRWEAKIAALQRSAALGLSNSDEPKLFD